MASSVRSFIANPCNHSGVFKTAIAALLFVLPVLGWQASAQNTTISGTVYDPRTTASALPLPNVLVYVTTGAVDPLPAGVQCLTTSTPTGVVSYTTTAVDGTFTLGNVPENATYTVVIQAGKWRRQFSETVAAGPLTGLALHMPSTHTQGDIPLIAIATGSVDALECVLREMGIADTEFTDDNGTTNPGGRIHLYKGDFSPGAEINASTPSETLLMGTPTNTTLLDSYDMVMFPCQGSPYAQSTTELTNLLNYANTGGRVFTTHYSYDRLDPASPYDSQFPPVANWHINQTSPTPDPGVATINTNFTDGATLAQWLQNAGASYNNTSGQIQISTLRHDLDSVIPPTQSWLTLNNTTAGNPVMQFTFNTPVGAAATNQCGRVLYNEYHVFNASGSGALFPHECPSSMTMTAQGEMLEYALFDLSSFVTPVVVPTLSIAITPSPLIVKQGDSADEVTVDVTNTSSTVEIYSSVVLTLTLPTGVTATSLTDATGGWICTLSTLTCTRTTSLAASASDSVTLTVSVPTYTSGTGTRGTITAVASSPNFSNNVTATDTVIFQQQPAITWATPAPITYGTPLSGTQLDATSTLPGSLSYNPLSGTVLGIGQHTLTATFTPTDTLNYTTSTATVTQSVIPATPIVALTSNANPVFTLNPVTYTATITTPAAAPTGTVAFIDGTTQVGSGTVTAGEATFATTAPASGIHSMTAVYSGDSNYNTATSPVLSETVQDFTVTLPNGNGSTTTVSLGGHETYPIVITPVGGTTLPGAVSLSVSGLQVGMTSTLTPDVVAANSPTSNVSLVVTLPGAIAAQPPPTPFGKGSLPVALGLMLLPLAGRLRKAAHRFRRVVVLALAGAALAAGLTGCQPNFTPQTYSFTLTATSGNLSHTTTMDIIVQ